MGESRIGGVLRAYGVYAEVVQKIVRMHCERGNVHEMVLAIAEYLLSDGMTKGRVPHNVGVKTQDLLDRTEEALRKEAHDYHQAGGVLVAKGYVSQLGLTAEMAKQWLDGFSSLQASKEKDIGQGLSDPEIQDRLTVVAMKLRALIMNKAVGSHANGMLPPDLHTLILKLDDLEGICQAAAMQMFKAFNEPNAATHEIVHGRKP